MFLHFEKHLNMSTLIANKVHVRIITYVSLFPRNVYNNNYNNNYLFDILLTQLFVNLLTTEIFKPRLFCSNATSHKAD